MDSGNSGSMQSSSGGDEEYDSRADSLSAFLNTPGGFAALSHQHGRMPTTSLHHHPPQSSASPSLFDPFSIYLDAPFTRSPQSPSSNSIPLLNLDVPWPRGLGTSDPPPSCTDVGSLMGSAPRPSNSIPTPMGSTRDICSGGVGISALPSSSLPPPLQQPSSAPAATAAAAAAPMRSAKKRSRASRRASTTVLTTDTSNFRAMVQEFTGLPAPPFSSSPFPRARFDLLHAAASSMMRSSPMSDASTHYLLRPFAQQLPILSSGPLSLGSSSATSFSPSAIAGTVGSTTNVTTAPANATAVAVTEAPSTSRTSSAVANTNTTTSVATASATGCTNTASTSSYQLPSNLGLETQHHCLPSMFNYPSLVQPSPSTNYSSANVPSTGTKKATPSAAVPSPAAAALADYTVVGGLRHGHGDDHLGTFLSPTEPTGLISSRGSGETGVDDLLRWVDGPAGRASDRRDQGQFRPAGRSCTGSQRGSSSCKLKHAGSVSSECHAEKGSENDLPSARGEGMLDSWICSSD